MACRALGQNRSSQRYRAEQPPAAISVIQRIDEIKQEHPTWGYRRITNRMQLEGWTVSYKRIRRLYQAVGLHAIRRHKQRRRTNKGFACRATAPGEIWACDWTIDEDSRGRALFWIAVIDEFSRQCVGMTVVRQVTGPAIVETLAKAVADHGLPTWIRCDNDELWQNHCVRRWRAEQRVGSMFIRRKSPWENGVIESFFAQLRSELLDRVEFTCLVDARAVTGQWQHEYNHLRAMPVLGYRTPAEAAGAWRQLRFRFDEE